MDNKTNRGKLVRKYIGEEIEKFKETVSSFV